MKGEVKRGYRKWRDENGVLHKELADAEDNTETWEDDSEQLELLVESD